MLYTLLSCVCTLHHNTNVSNHVQTQKNPNLIRVMDVIWSPVNGIASPLYMNQHARSSYTFILSFFSHILMVHVLDYSDFQLYCLTGCRILVNRQRSWANVNNSSFHQTVSEKHWLLTWNCLFQGFYHF